jgi:hypothetical protein
MNNFNEQPPQQAAGYQDSRLIGSGASSGELTRFRTEPSSARHGSSVTLVKITVAALALTCLLAAGCSNSSTPPAAPTAPAANPGPAPTPTNVPPAGGINAAPGHSQTGAPPHPITQP